MPKNKNNIISKIFLDKNNKLVIVQFPNLALWIAILAWLGLIFIKTGPFLGTITIVYRIALACWAIIEIGWGVTIFRRVLGLVVLLSIAVAIVQQA